MISLSILLLIMILFNIFRTYQKPVLVQSASATVTVAYTPAKETVTEPAQPTATAILTTVTPTRVSPQTGMAVPQELVPDDGNAYNGYWWLGEGWVPGLITFSSQFLRMPTVSVGAATFYAPQAMEAQVEYRGLIYDKTKYVGAVAVAFCSELGHDVWLKRPGSNTWEGPFLVADCGRRNDIYGMVEFRDQVVEVDFDTAVLWGMARYGGKQNGGRWSTLTGRLDMVLVSKVPPEQFDGAIVDQSVWFLQNVQFAKPSENSQCIMNYIPPFGTWYNITAGNLPMWLLCDKGWTIFP